MKKNQITNIAVSPVIYKDKFLLIKRVKWPYKNLWSLPGGKMELGEHPNDTIVREVKEETGINTKFVAIRGVVSEILYDRDPWPKGRRSLIFAQDSPHSIDEPRGFFAQNKNKIDGQFLIWVCETKSQTDKAIEQDEGEVKWFTKEELVKNKEKIIPSDYKMIETFFLKSRSKLVLHKSHMHKNGKTYLLEYFDSK